jgi:hypothetical protein
MEMAASRGLMAMSIVDRLGRAVKDVDSRIALLRIDQICDFEVQGKVGLVVGRVASIIYLL